MAAIADDLNAIDVTVTSPDGRIEGRAESLKYITLRFLHNSYERYYRHRDAELRQHVLQGLHRERRLTGLVAAAVQADHEPVADELIGAHPLDLRHVLDAFGPSGRDIHQHQNSQQGQAFGEHDKRGLSRTVQTVS